jgi:dGTPase
MSDKVVIVKVEKNAKNDILKYAEESLEKDKKNFYNPLDIDKKYISQLLQNSKDHDTFIFIMIVFVDDLAENKLNIEGFYCGDANFTNENKINYQIRKYITSKLLIDNFISNSDIDLKADFKKKSYLLVSYSKILYEQLKIIIYPPYEQPSNSNHTYKDSYTATELSDFAHHNKDCKRIVGILDEQKNRNEFQRDRERIVNSKSFRRLVDKAQIFTFTKGDHYRTRMTHTLEVNQIAKAISYALNLNIDLTESIALAHDIGHTPFGHQGERTLDSILKNKIKIIEIPKDLENNFHNEFGGFKHNYQGLRVLTCLEEKYVEFKGLDISTQVLEGIIKHTKLKPKNCTSKCKQLCEQDCFETSAFIDKKYEALLHMEFKNASTLEGQVVAIADEIAQRSHDIDDALLSGILSEENFMDYIKINSMKELEKSIRESYHNILNSERPLIDKHALFRARIISNITNYLINDVIKNSQNKIKEFQNKYNIYDKCFKEPLIVFSTDGERINNYLEKIISKIVINSSDVSKFDNNAESIITELFKAYYNNPRLIHKDYLKRIYIDFKNSNNPDVSTNIIDFINGDFKLVKYELEKITKLKIKRTDSIDDNEDSEIRTYIEYWEKRKILVRAIADYISGMTDNYAISEYNSIYHKS